MNKKLIAAAVVAGIVAACKPYNANAGAKYIALASVDHGIGGEIVLLKLRSHSCKSGWKRALFYSATDENGRPDEQTSWGCWTLDKKDWVIVEMDSEEGEKPFRFPAMPIRMFDVRKDRGSL